MVQLSGLRDLCGTLYSMINHGMMSAFIRDDKMSMSQLGMHEVCIRLIKKFISVSI